MKKKILIMFGALGLLVISGCLGITKNATKSDTEYIKIAFLKKEKMYSLDLILQ